MTNLAAAVERDEILKHLHGIRRTIGIHKWFAYEADVKIIDAAIKLLQAETNRPPVAGPAELVAEESEQEADLHYCDVAESFVRKMRLLGPITAPEAIAIEAVIARLRRYSAKAAREFLGKVDG